jgi:hypothetical protein
MFRPLSANFWEVFSLSLKYSSDERRVSSPPKCQYQNTRRHFLEGNNLEGDIHYVITFHLSTLKKVPLNSERNESVSRHPVLIFAAVCVATN